MFVFKRSSLPVARSIHYQLIDIQLDEVQQMVHDNDGQVKRDISPCSIDEILLFVQEQECTETDGWCVSDYQNRAREMMSTAHEQLYRQYQRERGNGTSVTSH